MAMTMVVRLYKDEQSGWRWTARLGSRVVGASSESYKRRADAIKNFETLRIKPHVWQEADGTPLGLKK